MCRQRSRPIAPRANRLHDGLRVCSAVSARCTGKHIGHRGTFGHAHDLGKQVVGERLPGGGRPGTQGSVNRIGDVANLNRSDHPCILHPICMARMQFSGERGGSRNLLGAWRPAGVQQGDAQDVGELIPPTTGNMPRRSIEPLARTGVPSRPCGANFPTIGRSYPSALASEPARLHILCLALRLTESSPPRSQGRGSRTGRSAPLRFATRRAHDPATPHS